MLSVGSTNNQTLLALALGSYFSTSLMRNQMSDLEFVPLTSDSSLK